MKVVVLCNLEPVMLDNIMLLAEGECLAVCIPEQDIAYLMGCLPENMNKKIAHLKETGIKDLLKYGYGEPIFAVEEFINPSECVAEFEVEIEE